MQKKKLYLGDTMLLNYSPKKISSDQGGNSNPSSGRDSSNYSRKKSENIKGKHVEKLKSFKNMYEMSKDAGGIFIIINNK